MDPATGPTPRPSTCSSPTTSPEDGLAVDYHLTTIAGAGYSDVTYPAASTCMTTGTWSSHRRFRSATWTGHVPEVGQMTVTGQAKKASA